VSQQNVEIVHSAFEAFAASGVEAGLSFFAPDVVYDTTDRWPEGSAYRGREGMRALATGWSDNFDSWGYEVEDVRAVGDCVVALTHMVGQIKNSEQSVSQPLGLVFSNFRNGTCGHVRAFATWQEALRAVGQEG
jgi:ketosteroid isomerase-like protein